MIKEKYITSSCIISNAVVYKNEKLIFQNGMAVLSDFLIAVYNHLGIQYPKFHKMDNLSKLGLLATEILLNESFPKDKFEAKDIGLVLTNKSSSLDTDIKYYETTKGYASPALFVYTLPNIVIGEICIRHHFKGENAFFVSEEFDAEFIKDYVSNLFNNNILQCCICGWIELLDDQYKAVLFLVENETNTEGELFSKENLNKIYQIENG